MQTYVPDDIVEKIRQGIDIVDVISEYVALKKTGQNYKGFCPFHQEKTPSFIVSPSKQIYHCFGCGVGGDVFNFLVRHERISFPEAMRILANRAGVTIPVRKRHADVERDILLKANKDAADYYHRILLENTAGADAREYLEKRGITRETVKRFFLGYSMNSWDGLLGYLSRKGFSPQILEKAGLVIPRGDASGYYDRFRGRIIFPIFNLQGEVIAFGGRVIKDADDSSIPKYLNSPETALYNKGESLYALYQAKENIRRLDFAILVEGYMDALMSHQLGVNNAVATLGTALTMGHLREIRRYTKNIAAVFDADTAGIKATLRGFDLFIESGMKVKVVSLSEGEDPDSFLKKKGEKEFLQIIKNSPDYIHFTMKQHIRSGIFSFEEKLHMAEEAIELIAKIPDSIERGAYLKRLSEELQIEEVFIREKLALICKKKEKIKRQMGQQKKSQENWEAEASPTHIGGITPQGRGDFSRPFSEQNKKRDTAEESLIQILITHPEITQKLAGRLDSEDLTDPLLSTIVQHILLIMQSGEKPDMERIIATLKDENAIALITRYSLTDVEYDDVEKAANDCLDRIKENRLRDALTKLQRTPKEKGASEVTEELNMLLRKKQEHSKKKGYS